MGRKVLGDLGLFLDLPFCFGFLRQLTTVIFRSTREQGYTVSDCTGEGLKAVLHLQYDLE